MAPQLPQSRLVKHRWTVERTCAWLAEYRRLAVRDERPVGMHRGFLHLARVAVRLGCPRPAVVRP